VKKVGKDYFDPDTCPRKHIGQGIDAEEIDLPLFIYDVNHRLTCTAENRKSPWAGANPTHGL
jgi:hypothetical protein